MNCNNVAWILRFAAGSRRAGGLAHGQQRLNSACTRIEARPTWPL